MSLGFGRRVAKAESRPCHFPLTPKTPSSQGSSIRVYS
jgi:hypothetical protein